MPRAEIGEEPGRKEAEHWGQRQVHRRDTAWNTALQAEGVPAGGTTGYVVAEQFIATMSLTGMPVAGTGIMTARMTTAETMTTDMTELADGA